MPIKNITIKIYHKLINMMAEQYSTYIHSILKHRNKENYQIVILRQFLVNATSNDFFMDKHEVKYFKASYFEDFLKNT